MKLTLAARKSIGDLTAEDLRQFPVWEWTSDEEGREGQDETFVRPVRCRVLHLDPLLALHVASDFTAADGTTYEGYVSVTSDEIDDGGLFVPQGSLWIPYEWSPKSERKKFLRSLRSTEKRIYPLLYRLRVPFSGEKKPYSGVFE
jgi:hypothetical protein